MSFISMMTEEQLRSIVDESHSWDDVIRKCQLKTITRALQRRLLKFNIDCSHFEQHFDGKYTRINKYTKEQIAEIVNANSTWSDIMTAFKYTSCQNVPQIQAKLQKLDIDYSHVDASYTWTSAKISLEDILVKDSTYSSMPYLKIRLQKELGWENRCSICKFTEWNGKPIPIQIDHINGDHWDNTITNIRFLCPNCHAQTDTYCGKNMKIHKEKKLVEKTPQLSTRRAKKEPKECIDCMSVLQNRRSERCKDCDMVHRTTRRVVERPSHEQLLIDRQSISMVKIGKKYGVSDNAVRKWIKHYEKIANRENFL